MEKILLAVDAIDPNYNALDFACYLARVTRSKVTAIFLENLVDDDRTVLQPAYLTDTAVKEKSFPFDEHSNRVKLVEDNIKRFKVACENREVNYNLFRDRGLPIDELINESRFADLLILDAATTFSKRFEGTPSEFVKDILSHAECAVIIAPESFDYIDELVFSYDGSASSVFAIKQFTHIFPQFVNKKVSVVQVTDDGDWNDPNRYIFKKWLEAHYNDMHFEALEGNIETQLFEYLFKRKNVFIVMGAYGRNFISRFFKRSNADLIIKTVTQPIFITHL